MFRRGIFGKIKSVSRDGIDQPLIDMIINPNHLSGVWYKSFVRDSAFNNTLCHP